MTGPEHYREAEHHLNLAIDNDNDGDHAATMVSCALAQVHATLALTEAVAAMEPR